ncbi:MAG: DUF2249 domain-containing protein [Actinomycetota bacterium]
MSKGSSKIEQFVGSSPEWLALAMDVPAFDVRPALAQGGDPFSAIMERAEGVGFGGVFVVDAPFNPSPLRRILAGCGFSSFGRKLAEGHWRVYFHRDGGAAWEADAEVEVMPEGAMAWREEDGIHIDVRRLQPPQPMVAILRLIEGLSEPCPIIVHHDREPRYLAPELAERGWAIVRTESEFANIRLWLERSG